MNFQGASHVAPQHLPGRHCKCLWVFYKPHWTVSPGRAVTLHVLAPGSTISSTMSGAG